MTGSCLKRTKYPRDLSLSCIRGFEKSNNKFILVMDGDGQHHPKYIKRKLKKMNNRNLDFVIGTRNLFKKKKHNLSILRLTASRLLILIVNLFLLSCFFASFLPKVGRVNSCGSISFIIEIMKFSN